jgi:hypothetical protein
MVAEMSPDESEMTVLVKRELNSAPAIVELQKWDYHDAKLLFSRSLGIIESSPSHLRRELEVVYTHDGELLVTFAGGISLHVLRSSDMSELRVMQVGSNAAINAMKASPTTHQLAVRTSDEILLYDLDSGQKIRQWRISELTKFPTDRILFRPHPQFDASGLAWRENGTVLAISIADDQRCLSGGGTIVLLDPASSEPTRTFRVPTFPSSLAFGVGADLYVASNTCAGYFTHWTLDLPIFDTTTGHEKSAIPAGHVGFRGTISISTDKQYLLSHADREKETIEGLEDTLTVSDEQWQVWNLSTRKNVLALPATDRDSADGSLKLSDLGHFVYGIRGQELLLFDVPRNE